MTMSMMFVVIIELHTKKQETLKTIPYCLNRTMQLKCALQFLALNKFMF